jgi:hypothetical protein
MLLMRVKVMTKMRQNIELVITQIIQARRLIHELTAEEIIQKFPHAVSGVKYVNGKLKISLHSLPKSIKHSN